MTQIILSDFVSLDGVSQAPGGPDEDTDGGFAHGGWSAPFFDPETMGAAIGGLMEQTDALLFGRRTWDGMAAAWPERAGDPFADQMNAIKKYVVSRTLKKLDWSGSHLLDGDVVPAVKALKEQPGGEIQLWGSLALVETLVREDLVDEYLIYVHPLVLGRGKRVFPEDAKPKLRLVDTKTFETGVVLLTYQPER